MVRARRVLSTFSLWIACFLPIHAEATANLQERFESGELRGFTRSPTEHVINELDKVIQVQRIKGVVIFVEHNAEPISGVLFEVRGPGASPVVRGVKTDTAGCFKLKHIVPGRYKFKATLNGFQSVIGTIEVSKAGKSDPILIELHVGV